VQYYQRAIQAGNTHAMNDLGHLYRVGKGLTQDDTLAMVWYQRSADAGYAVGMFNVGWMYQHSTTIGINYAKAIGWYNKAADKGDIVSFRLQKLSVRLHPHNPTS
jgi:TPR repeat protein